MHHGWLRITMVICCQPDHVRLMSSARAAPCGKFCLRRRRQKRSFRIDLTRSPSSAVSSPTVTRICFHTNIPTRVRLSRAYLANIHKNDSSAPLMSMALSFSFGVFGYPILPHKVCNASVKGINVLYRNQTRQFCEGSNTFFQGSLQPFKLPNVNVLFFFLRLQ